jgi:hypothetical protein
MLTVCYQCTVKWLSVALPMTPQLAWRVPSRWPSRVPRVPSPDSHTYRRPGCAGSPFQDVPRIRELCLVPLTFTDQPGLRIGGRDVGGGRLPFPVEGHRRVARMSGGRICRPFFLKLWRPFLKLLSPTRALMRGSGYRSVQPMLTTLPRCFPLGFATSTRRRRSRRYQAAPKVWLQVVRTLRRSDG